jgi:spermidine synthase
MALIWSREAHGNRYEVRSAGRSVRLYTNGVFHSQFNPARPFAGSVWDLLLLPALLQPHEAIRRVLLLGVGGGAVVRMCRQLYPQAQLVGVELDPVHLQVARRFFAAEGEGVSLIQGDAIGWLERYRGEPFDLIIDDLFGDSGGEPQRAVALQGRWFGRLLAALGDEGVIVTNCVSSRELHTSAPFTNLHIGRRFRAAFAFSHPLYDNAIGAFYRGDQSSRGARRRIEAALAVYSGQKGCKLDHYRIRSLTGSLRS